MGDDVRSCTLISDKAKKAKAKMSQMVAAERVLAEAGERSPDSRTLLAVMAVRQAEQSLSQQELAPVQESLALLEDVKGQLPSLIGAGWASSPGAPRTGTL